MSVAEAAEWAKNSREIGNRGDERAFQRCCQTIRVREEALARLTAEVERLTNQKDGAYNERDHLVAALSKFFPASLERHPAEEEWDDDWRWIVFIELPTGQVSWHLHDSEVGYFAHLARETGRKWDGHSTPEKYGRLAALSLPTPAPEATDGTR